MEEDLKPISLEEILEYVKHCNNKEDEHFLPQMIFSAVVDNKEYDPLSFDEELEKTEEPVPFTGENVIYHRNPNSDAWKKNHSKICKTSLIFPWVCSDAHAYTMDGNEHNSFRTHYNEITINRIKEEYQKLKDMGIQIYAFA